MVTNNRMCRANLAYNVTLYTITRLQQIKRIQCADEANITNIGPKHVFFLNHALHTKFSVCLQSRPVVKKVSFCSKFG